MLASWCVVVVAIVAVGGFVGWAVAVAVQGAVEDAVAVAFISVVGFFLLAWLFPRVLQVLDLPLANLRRSLGWRRGGGVTDAMHDRRPSHASLIMPVRSMPGFHRPGRCCFAPSANRKC